MEKIVSLGSISFFVNDPVDHRLSDDDICELEEWVVSQYQGRIETSPIGDRLKIVASKSHRGCVVITVTIAAVFVGTTAFLKDYEQIRNGAVRLAKDLNGLRIKLVKWKKEHRIWFYRNDTSDGKSEIQ